LRDAAWELISTSPYFRRCWIRQEREAAREIIVACGPHALPLDDFNRHLSTLLPPLEDGDIRCINPADQKTRNLLRYIYFRDSHGTGRAERTQIALDKWDCINPAEQHTRNLLRSSYF